MIPDTVVCCEMDTMVNTAAIITDTMVDTFIITKFALPSESHMSQQKDHFAGNKSCKLRPLVRSRRILMIIPIKNGKVSGLAIKKTAKVIIATAKSECVKVR